MVDPRVMHVMLAEEYEVGMDALRFGFVSVLKISLLV